MLNPIPSKRRKLSKFSSQPINFEADTFEYPNESNNNNNNNSDYYPHQNGTILNIENIHNNADNNNHQLQSFKSQLQDVFEKLPPLSDVMLKIQPDPNQTLGDLFNIFQGKQPPFPSQQFQPHPPPQPYTIRPWSHSPHPSPQPHVQVESNHSQLNPQYQHQPAQRQRYHPYQNQKQKQNQNIGYQQHKYSQHNNNNSSINADNIHPQIPSSHSIDYHNNRYIHNKRSRKRMASIVCDPFSRSINNKSTSSNNSNNSNGNSYNSSNSASINGNIGLSLPFIQSDKGDCDSIDTNINYGLSKETDQDLCHTFTNKSTTSISAVAVNINKRQVPRNTNANSNYNSNSNSNYSSNTISKPKPTADNISRYCYDTGDKNKYPAKRSNYSIPADVLQTVKLREIVCKLQIVIRNRIFYSLYNNDKNNWFELHSTKNLK